ncbi:hypothetical protein ACHAWT_002473 [Skeletonema menzelii]
MRGEGAERDETEGPSTPSTGDGVRNTHVFLDDYILSCDPPISRDDTDTIRSPITPHAMLEAYLMSSTLKLLHDEHHFNAIAINTHVSSSSLPPTSTR